MLDCWPHLRALLARHGFRHEGQTEVILVADAADTDWLRLGHGDRLLAYCLAEQTEALPFAKHTGLRELTRTERGWVRPARRTGA